jgi:GNAT superfamily N-acetyltransferase
VGFAARAMAMVETAQIRELTVADKDEVLELLGQLWPEKCIDPATAGGIIERYVKDPGYWIYGYEVEGALQGLVTVSFRWTLFHDGQVAIIEDLVVGEAHRGQGVGTALVRFVEDRMVREGKARAVEVNSDLDRDAAHEFWTGCGYTRLAFQFRKTIP